MADAGLTSPRKLLVLGHGMVGHRLCESLIELGALAQYQVTVVGEEPRPAYDRVQLTHFFETRDPQSLAIATREQYREHGIELLTGTRAEAIDREQQQVRVQGGRQLPYDALVLATGSAPFVPPIPGVVLPGVFVYRTIEDLEAIITYAAGRRRAAVIGGGLLGLEAARAVQLLGLETHVVEAAPRLMPRQLDTGAGAVLAAKIRALGVGVHLGHAPSAIEGDERVERLCFADGRSLAVDLVVISAGIRPRVELARQAGLALGDRGGVLVDDGLATSDPSIFAIGEVASHRGTVYGLVAPGYAMAEVLAKRLAGDAEALFEGADQSTKLKLMGIDVASFGDALAPEDRALPVVLSDFTRGSYKKLLLDPSGTRVLGGMLVGDASRYGELLQLARSGEALLGPPETLLVDFPSAGAGGAVRDSLVCTCNGVSKSALCKAIGEGKHTVSALKGCTRAGTGCGGCLPQVADVLGVELTRLGKAERPRLCEHFAYTRTELFALVKVEGIRTFGELIARHGTGHGCEICKPTAASIFASTHNEMVLDRHATLQDTNDRYLANIQRGGTYSVIPRIPGGEITPDKLMVIGRVAKRYGLYCKITGGQRIDLLGARIDDLPNIWEDLVNAGFESGHAYAKAVRTVKSCVGSTWCRYGVQDSVGMAIRIEQRYRGIRAPHKLKSAVSGCTRECAEAQSKDFGVIATEKGWNLYVCGNGGMKPRHADLLAADLDDETLIKYVDRFLMYYIKTADRLTRTSVWLEKLEGGIEHLRDVVVRDSLGLCTELERMAQHLVSTYECEWKAVVKDAGRAARFRQLVNSRHPDPSVPFIRERGQLRPAAWSEAPRAEPRRLPIVRTQQVRAGRVESFPRDGGLAIDHGGVQIAVFNLASEGRWYATQNMCPHKQELVLARGLCGDQRGEPKVACPLHKKTFSLRSGACLSGDAPAISTFPVSVVDGEVLVELPEPEALPHLRCGEKCEPAAEAAE